MVDNAHCEPSVPPQFTMAQTARALGVHVRTLRRHVQSGEIGFIRVGTGDVHPRRRFLQSHIDCFLEARQSKIERTSTNLDEVRRRIHQRARAEASRRIECR
jgi:excisionase family DNA binding protein